MAREAQTVLKFPILIGDIGGTNARGWQVGGNYAVAPNLLFGGRWMSAEEIAGSPFSVDRFFIDLSTQF